VPDRAAVEPPHRDGEVALQPQVDEELVRREALADPARVGDDVGAGHDLRARRALDAVLQRIGEAAALPAGEEAREAGRVRQELGDEGDVSPERLRGVLDEALEELLADRARGALGDEPEEVLVLGGDGHGTTTLPRGPPFG
jgi:hypothetical protein